MRLESTKPWAWMGASIWGWLGDAAEAAHPISGMA